ncbi:MAG: CHASE2 domain-containing protein [Saprospiraceae bacterium]|nr:CHASE2 domain-containing protein [Lewinella sp.]
MPKRVIHWHALIVTVIIFLFIGLMKLVTFQSHFFDPFNNGVKDYEVTDIIFSRLRDTTRVRREMNVVLVHVQHPERAAVASMLERINAQSPAVIGLDILFRGSRDSLGDSLLSRQLRTIPNVVMAANLGNYVDSLKGIPHMLVSEPEFSGHAVNGYTNFVAGQDRTVRLFSPAFTTLDGRRHLAFAVALAEQFDPTRTKRLFRRKKEVERINYLGDYRSYIRLDAATVLEAPDEALAVFRDRIVMIGYVHSNDADAPIEDRYYTPLNPVYTGRSIPDMYGMVIHANIVSMILNGEYIYDLPKWITTILIWLFGYGNVLIIKRIYNGLPDIFHGITRLLQILELMVAFFLIALLFHYFRIRVDFSNGFLALILAYDILMIYESFLRKRIPFLTKIT